MITDTQIDQAILESLQNDVYEPTFYGIGTPPRSLTDEERKQITNKPIYIPNTAILGGGDIDGLAQARVGINTTSLLQATPILKRKNIDITPHIVRLDETNLRPDTLLDGLPNLIGDAAYFFDYKHTQAAAAAAIIVNNSTAADFSGIANAIIRAKTTQQGSMSTGRWKALMSEELWVNLSTAPLDNGAMTELDFIIEACRKNDIEVVKGLDAISLPNSTGAVLLSRVASVIEGNGAYPRLIGRGTNEETTRRWGNLLWSIGGILSKNDNALQLINFTGTITFNTKKFSSSSATVPAKLLIKQLEDALKTATPEQKSLIEGYIKGLSGEFKDYADATNLYNAAVKAVK
jgi:hypothetical protein